MAIRIATHTATRIATHTATRLIQPFSVVIGTMGKLCVPSTPAPITLYPPPPLTPCRKCVYAFAREYKPVLLVRKQGRDIF